MKATYSQFEGTVPANYDRYLGPLFFEPYALDLAQRAGSIHVTNVLEIACGTGRVTKHLMAQLPPSATLTATDLNADMLAVAKQRVTHPNLHFAEADAQQLPFDAEAFDSVVCQFGFMFVPNKQKAFDEAYRVLKTGGFLLFNTWDSLENNELTYTVKNTVAKYFDEDAASFYDVPFSFYDQSVITSLLQHAGFTHIQVERVTKKGAGLSASDAAKGLLLGTPVYKLLLEKEPGAVEKILPIATREVARLFGENEIQTTLNAFVYQAEK